ncbi:MAG: DUF6210 family protein [Actinomycetota bacterium]
MPALRRVFLDPDGSLPDLFGVIIQHPTGVRFEHQCGGVETLHFGVEGYFVPLGRLHVVAEEGVFDLRQLTEVFHNRNACVWRGNPGKLPPNTCHLPADRLEQLRALVAAIPYWICDEVNTEQRHQLRLDDARLGELVEAWVPVTTPDGPGVLIWENCD